MRTAWPALLLLLGCGAPPSTGPGAEAAAPSTPLGDMQGAHMVFYNVENLFDTHDDPATNDADFLPGSEQQWTPERYRHKLEQLSKAITWAGEGPPLLIGLAEVENATVVKDLARTGALADAPYIVVHHDSPDERGIDVTLLVDRDRARVRREEALTVDLPGDATRDVLYAALDVDGPQDLHVFVAHWPSRREGQRESEPKRMAAAHLIRERVNDLLDQDAQALVLIMGDLNDHPTDRSVQEGLGAGCDPQADADLYALMCMDRLPGEGSHQYNGEWAYLDQFIVSKALLDRTLAARAVSDQRLLFHHPKFGPSPDKTYSGGHYKGGFSDHLPVVLRLK
jgi:predicted extracellular nuclease